MDWLQKTQPYSKYDTSWAKKPTSKLYRYTEISHDLGDTETNTLLNCLRLLWNKDSPKLEEDFIAHYANHPAVTNIAKQLNVTPAPKINTPEKIKSIISDWYETENKLMLAKQNSMPNIKDLQQIFKKQSRELADMLLEAARRWFYLHKDYKKMGTSQNYLDTAESMKWVIRTMSKANPTQADISIALQKCHMEGSILQYIPYSQNEPYGNTKREDDVLYISDFLSNLSNSKTIPEVTNHNIIHELSPIEERDMTWRGVQAKIKLSNNKFRIPHQL